MKTWLFPHSVYLALSHVIKWAYLFMFRIRACVCRPTVCVSNSTSLHESLEVITLLTLPKKHCLVCSISNVTHHSLKSLTLGIIYQCSAHIEHSAHAKSVTLKINISFLIFTLAYTFNNFVKWTKRSKLIYRHIEKAHWIGSLNPERKKCMKLHHPIK